MGPEAQNWYKYSEKCWAEKKPRFLEKKKHILEKKKKILEKKKNILEKKHLLEKKNKPSEEDIKTTFNPSYCSHI